MADEKTKYTLDKPIGDDEEEFDKGAIYDDSSDDGNDYSKEDSTEDSTEDSSEDIEEIKDFEISNQYLMVLFNDIKDFEEINAKFTKNDNDRKCLVVHQNNIIMTTFAPLEKIDNAFGKSHYFATTIIQYIKASEAFKSLFKLIDKKYSDVKVSLIYRDDDKMVNSVNFLNKDLILKVSKRTILFENMKNLFTAKKVEKQRFQKTYDKRPRTEQRKESKRYDEDDRRRQQIQHKRIMHDEKPARREDKEKEIRRSTGRRLEPRSQYPRKDETIERKDRSTRRETVRGDREPVPYAERERRGNSRGEIVKRRDDKEGVRGNVDRRRAVRDQE